MHTNLEVSEVDESLTGDRFCPLVMCIYGPFIVKKLKIKETVGTIARRSSKEEVNLQDKL